jgi:hypothetical protein
MKLFYALILIIITQGCSFDDKTGIWKNENITSDKENVLFKEFKSLNLLQGSFKEIIPLDKNFKFKLPSPVTNKKWLDIYYNKTNNLVNFKYKNENRLIFKSKKITKYPVNKYILFEKNNLITSDDKGNIFIFSTDQNRIIDKFNFYKKRYKKIKKNLSLIVENNIIYVSDNIGYLYAYDYKISKILWAKNYKIPFRSNIKLINNQLVTSNQNNDLYFFNKKDGVILKQIPTEETSVKNQFQNNLSLGNKSLFFLNTYGSLYSIDNKTLNINWFINLNQSIDIDPSNLFMGTQIIHDEKRLIVTSNKYTYILNANNGSIISKKNFSSLNKPILINNYAFFISKNKFLISIDTLSGKILYSYNINDQIANFLKIKKKQVAIKNIMIINNEIFVFLQNSFTLRFNIKGNLISVKKLPTKLFTDPIIIDDLMLYIDLKNKLAIVN